MGNEPAASASAAGGSAPAPAAEDPMKALLEAVKQDQQKK
jgi:hypothetical protein